MENVSTQLNFYIKLIKRKMLGSISAVSRVQSLILPEERALSGDECGFIFPYSGW